MAEQTSHCESFLSCYVCSETFRDPVSLSCNHSFCSSCLKTFWEQAKNKNCPTCKRKASKDDPGVNFGLEELADSFAGGQKAGSPETEKGEKKVEELCSKHQEEAEVFCEDEDGAVCPVCEFSLQSQKVFPIEQVVSDLQDQLKSPQDKRDKYKQVEKTCEEMSQKVFPIEQAVSDLQDQLKSLQDKRDKYKQVEKTCEGMELADSFAEGQTAGSPVEQAVRDLEDQLKSLQDKRDKYKQVEKTVRNGDSNQQLPDNPERNTAYANVLGSKGFSSGTHRWEVEVGDHPHWNVGLAKESVDRKGKEANTSPDDGVWCVTRLSGNYIDVVGETIRVKKSLQRIGVHLDYDRGEVSFYDPEDMTRICTHRDTFTEKLFPWFSIGPAGDAQTADIKICQTVRGGW
ncbi:zinc-binding protein A33-like [Sebastes fasciatus]|uniref:zinc-binding protein A33-like n=1 Tax=Sebastes fasciatus TaxID=394691 RepID=UPI003D9E4DC5